MLILLSAVVFGFGLLLFSVGLVVWLIGLTIRIAILLFQLGLLLVWTGVAFADWLHRRRKVFAQGLVLTAMALCLMGPAFADQGPDGPVAAPLGLALNGKGDRSHKLADLVIWNKFCPLGQSPLFAGYSHHRDWEIVLIQFQQYPEEDQRRALAQEGQIITKNFRNFCEWVTTTAEFDNVMEHKQFDASRDDARPE